MTIDRPSIDNQWTSEPSLSDLLDDQVMSALLARDGITADDVRDLVAAVNDRLAAA